MSWFKRPLWFKRLFRRAQAEAELDEEIRFHLEQEARLRIERGESPQQAGDGARRDFGSVALVQETTRQMWGWMLVDDFARDLRHSLRLMVRSPLFTTVAVVSLALGIGANTAIFSLADAVIFRELPVREPQRLYQVRSVNERGDIGQIYSYPLYEEIRNRSQVFSAIVAAGSWAIVEPVSLILPNGTRRETRARVTAVSGSYFGTLGVDPAIGRMFTPDEDRAPGAHPVAVISYRFWDQSLDRDPGVVNTRFLHNNVSYQILGVASFAFKGVSSEDDPDIWVPLTMANSILGREVFKNADTSSLYVFGRLKPGVSETAASADVARVYRELQPTERRVNGQRGEVLSMAKGVQALRRRFEKPLLILLGVVGLLLLIACANLAGLLLARAAARRQEIAVRLSLGASRFRLMRQFLTESLLIGLAGGAAGLLVSSWGFGLLVAMVSTSTRRLPLQFTLDTRILTFTACVSVVTALLFGLLPALQANRTRITQTGSAARVHSRLPAARLLLVGQMALSLFLLIAAGLFLRSLVNLRHLDTGFARDNVMVLMLDPRPAYGENIEQYSALFRELPGRIEALPGVRSASFSSATFFGGSSSRGNIAYEGQGTEAPRSEWPFKVRITPKFAATFGLSLIGGRTFTDRDDRNAPNVAMISESISKRYYPGVKPVGKRFCFSSAFAAQCALEIVGVVRDVRYSNLREASPYTVYLPVLQSPAQRGDLQVRTWSDPEAISAQVQEAVRRFNPGLRVVHTVTLDRLVEDSIVPDRLLALLAACFAVLALVLSALGLYGITAYGVHHRTREIGVRMALGASKNSVQWMVLRDVLLLAAAGAAIGVPAALAASGVLRGLLFGLTPNDPCTIGGAAVALIAIALVAGYLPARRASGVDPMSALRCD